MHTELETTLSQLISIPSVSSNPEACREIITFVGDQLAPYGLSITTNLETPHPWLLATTKATKEPDVLLAAHLDVVPAPAELFTMQKRDGKLIGRGAYDMKLAAACYLELLRNNAAALSDLNIGFLFTTDEEVGGQSMMDILESGLRPKVVFIPDGGDNWHIEERAKGFYNVEIVAHGKTAHGSRPWEGENALHRLIDAVQTLRQSFPSQKPEDSTLAVNQMQAGQAVNQIADYASVKIDFRTFSRDDLRAYRAQVERLAAENNFDVNVVHEGLPLKFDKHAPVVQDFLAALQAQTGESPRYTESYGGSDARFFAEYDIPCIIVEPRGGSRHAPDEWVSAEDLPRYYALLERWILQ